MLCYAMSWVIKENNFLPAWLNKMESNLENLEINVMIKEKLA